MSKKQSNKPTNLENCEPGGTKSEVLEALKKVVKTSKSSKNVQPPDSTL